MKITRHTFLKLIPVFLLLLSSFSSGAPVVPSLGGSWHWQKGSQEAVISFVDEYCVFTLFDKQNRKFEYTWGGPYRVVNNNIIVDVQFNSKQKELVGTSFSFAMSWHMDNLLAPFTGEEQEWKQLDNGKSALAGVWRITGRKQGDQISEMQLGPRRTLKILTGTRFQWAAINIDTKEFFGTGGGRYSFENGKYTEFIEFFSRDSSRVGASLGFDGKIENGAWHHSGLSSRGEPIYEIWKHINQ